MNGQWTWNSHFSLAFFFTFCDARTWWPLSLKSVLSPGQLSFFTYWNNRFLHVAFESKKKTWNINSWTAKKNLHHLRFNIFFLYITFKNSVLLKISSLRVIRIFSSNWSACFECKQIFTIFLAFVILLRKICLKLVGTSGNSEIPKWWN